MISDEEIVMLTVHKLQMEYVRDGRHQKIEQVNRS